MHPCRIPYLRTFPLEEMIGGYIQSNLVNTNELSTFKMINTSIRQEKFQPDNFTTGNSRGTLL